jgi:AcrR family transcriptional regulator
MALRPATARSPREVESEQTRRAILDAAEALLAGGGEAGLSIREVCRRAGVTPPTIYHHFGDKQGLVDRAVDDCFAAFDGALARRAAPADPVEALRWGFDRFIEYGREHPTHYRLMFQRAHARRTPGGLASFDRLRRMVAAVGAAGRLRIPVEEATHVAFFTVHGATSLIVSGLAAPDHPAVPLLRDLFIAEITQPAPGRDARAARGQKGRRS